MRIRFSVPGEAIGQNPLADFIMLSDDVMTMPEAEIRKVRVKLTVVAAGLCIGIRLVGVFGKWTS